MWLVRNVTAFRISYPIGLALIGTSPLFHTHLHLSFFETPQPIPLHLKLVKVSLGRYTRAHLVRRVTFRLSVRYPRKKCHLFLKSTCLWNKATLHDHINVERPLVAMCVNQGAAECLDPFLDEDSLQSLMSVPSNCMRSCRITFSVTSDATVM